MTPLAPITSAVMGCTSLLRSLLLLSRGEAWMRRHYKAMENQVRVFAHAYSHSVRAIMRVIYEPIKLYILSAGQ